MTAQHSFFLSQPIFIINFHMNLNHYREYIRCMGRLHQWHASISYLLRKTFYCWHSNSGYITANKIGFYCLRNGRPMILIVSELRIRLYYCFKGYVRHYSSDRLFIASIRTFAQTKQFYWSGRLN